MSDLARFVSRWSRLKRQRAVQSPTKDLPPLEDLAADADLSAYLGPEVEASLRRRALQRIFADPCLNVMDGLDVYIDDYSIADPISLEVLTQMNQARLLFAQDEACGPSPLDRASPGQMALADGSDALPVTDPCQEEQQSS